MDRLRELFEDLGLEGVATYIASGNVVFEATELLDEARAEAHLGAGLGFPVAVLVRPLADLERVAAFELPTPLGGRGFNVHVILLRREPGSRAERELKRLESEDDIFNVIGREAYWLRRGGLSESPITAAQIAAALGTEQTSRNMNTIRRMVAKFA